MQILRTVKIKLEGVTFCLVRPTALESVEISTQISQLHAIEGEVEVRFKELAELYINVLAKYTKEIRDIEIENDDGELEKMVVKSSETISYVINQIPLITISKLIVEYLNSLNPSESEKKS
jgi:hypothetical protein